MTAPVRTSLVSALAIALSTAAAGASAAPPEPAPMARAAVAAQGPEESWAVWGGELELAWNRHLMRDLGLTVSKPIGLLSRGVDGSERFRVREQVGLGFDVKGGAFAGFTAGAVGVRGGYRIEGAGVSIALTDFSLRVRPGDPYRLDVVSADGKAWFYVDRLMYEVVHETALLSLRSMDLRVAPALARAIGRPEAEGMTVAAAELYSPAFRGGVATKGGSCPDSDRWPGDSAGGLARYRADVFMEEFSAHYSRRTGDADGPGGSDGRVVFTPSSTLRNNRNDGSRVPTIPGDPLGTSQANYAADVPWREKFTANCPPYDNDQHPYLIWNLYRIDADGRITQVGRSGVKHAFLTINVGCDENPGSGHILGRGCSDTYGVGNNDSGNDLGPRGEILPSTGQWGRCGSIYDPLVDDDGDPETPPDCTGTDANFSGYSSFEHRMNVRESDIDASLHPGARWLFESWYIVRDDIDIYNTMQTREVAFDWTGSLWDVDNDADAGGSTLALGPAIDRWVPPAGTPAGQATDTVVLADGEIKVAVRVTPIGDGQFRYDYAVMNFDYAVPVTEGREPNLRVISNDGFVAFEVPLPSGVTAQSPEFADGDDEPDNDWTATAGAGHIAWTAPDDASLDWGTMFRFSFVAAAASMPGTVELTSAPGGAAAQASADILVPSGDPVVTYTVGGTVSGLEDGQSVTLALNAGDTVTVDADGAFVFADELTAGEAYVVTLDAVTGGAACTVSQGAGTIDDADVDDVVVRCGAIFVDGFEATPLP